MQILHDITVISTQYRRVRGDCELHIRPKMASTSGPTKKPPMCFGSCRRTRSSGPPTPPKSVTKPVVAATKKSEALPEVIEVKSQDQTNKDRKDMVTVHWSEFSAPFENDTVQKIVSTFLQTINKHNYGYPAVLKVSKIELFSNSHLEAEYKKTSRLIGNEEIAFHGTPTESNIDSIVQKGFDMKMFGKTAGNPGWYGAGMYLTRHAGAALRYQNWKPYGAPPKRMLVCKVLLGRSLMIPENSQDYIGKDLCKGYDSHQGKDRWDADLQIVVFNASQILPFALVHYD
jgi:hypothetical protein